MVTKVNTQKQGKFSNLSDYQVGLGKGIEERTQAVLNAPFPKGEYGIPVFIEGFQILPFSVRLLI